MLKIWGKLWECVWNGNIFAMLSLRENFVEQNFRGNLFLILWIASGCCPRNDEKKMDCFDLGYTESCNDEKKIDCFDSG